MAWREVDVCWFGVSVGCWGQGVKLVMRAVLARRASVMDVMAIDRRRGDGLGFMLVVFNGSCDVV
jgi:hypothetical protein